MMYFSHNMQVMDDSSSQPPQPKKVRLQGPSASASSLAVPASESEVRIARSMYINILPSCKHIPAVH